MSSLRLDWTFKASLLLDLIHVRTFQGLELWGQQGRKGDKRGSFPRLHFSLCLIEKNLNSVAKGEGMQGDVLWEF